MIAKIIPCYNPILMRRESLILVLLLLVAWPRAQEASGWEWQFSLGPWTLQPWTSPVAREAQRMVSAEAERMLAPLLAEFTVFSFEPTIDLRSSGWTASAGCWRRLKGDRIAIGLSASYVRFSLPFTLTDERDIYFGAIQLARISTQGKGQLDLRTFMLGVHGRWRLLRTGRIAAYGALGMTLLSFNGDLYLPLTASVQSFLGSAALQQTESKSLATLRAENDDIPSWILAPALTISLHYRLGSKVRLLIEANLSQGTFLTAGLLVGR